ncbi:hypothetical protein CIHG_09575 [Coccidioides immitis H538.4]|uniref:Uncharacterized protein n=1 Tax=Coccidioides immitis H538.4 TaxID=396776 RepID=A0A0J8S332_COCIT|nr:hypothetical protein CIHG_09575 [Coccidioides immitis H538.4]
MKPYVVAWAGDRRVRHGVDFSTKWISSPFANDRGFLARCTEYIWLPSSGISRWGTWTTDITVAPGNRSELLYRLSASSSAPPAADSRSGYVDCGGKRATAEIPRHQTAAARASAKPETPGKVCSGVGFGVEPGRAGQLRDVQLSYHRSSFVAIAASRLGGRILYGRRVTSQRFYLR